MRIWNSWLLPQQHPTSYSKFKHIELVESAEARPQVLNELARLLYAYHTRSRINTDLLAYLGYPQVANTMRGDQRPKASDPEETRKAHFAEILACEFARDCLEFEIPILRLRYNPNPSQSMKGDDILGFRFATIQDETFGVLVGEAKYRSSFDTDSVEDAFRRLSESFRPHPVSMEFVATVLDLEGDKSKAKQVRQIQSLLRSCSPRVSNHYLLFLATKGRPKDPFRVVQEKQDVPQNLTAVNIVFQDTIDEWINTLFEMEIAL